MLQPFKKIKDFNSVKFFSRDLPKHSSYIYKLFSTIYFNEQKKRKKISFNVDSLITKELVNLGCAQISENIKNQIISLNLMNDFNSIDWHGDEKVIRKKNWMYYYQPNLSYPLAKVLINIAKELSGYLDGMPILRSCFFWYSFNNSNTTQRKKFSGSQLLHRDNNDWRQIRLFFALDDVNQSNGALEYLDSKVSEKAFEYFNNKFYKYKRNLKIPDENIKIFEKSLIQNNIKKNNGFYIDTGNCYHRGSRVVNGTRKMFVVQFMTPFHIDRKIFKIKNFNKKLYEKDDGIGYYCLGDVFDK